MLGAIIGDIVGSRYEFHPTNNYDFELFGPGCGFTDDTICTIAVADAMLKGRDYGTSIHEWCRKYPNPMGGYGGSFRNWVLSDTPQPYGSYGNGSAMRVSPVGWMSDVYDLPLEAQKSAECTHSHKSGIDGAVAVAWAIYDCYQLRLMSKGRHLTPAIIRNHGLRRAIQVYEEDFDNFTIDLEKHKNKFDETCQGTVPVALWIVMHSTGFEDAIRRAVSLGADADTLGAIVGSIAEALWGIPRWIKSKALSYLPDEMIRVVQAFRIRVTRLRKITRYCHYYKIGGRSLFLSRDNRPRDIEKAWANEVARSYRNALNIKKQMFRLCSDEHWQNWAEEYQLPLSLVGYIFERTADSGMLMHERVDSFLCFLREYYTSENRQWSPEFYHLRAVMLWKLGLGNMARYLDGRDPMPPKDTIATARSWEAHPMTYDPHRLRVRKVEWFLSVEQLDILRRGHIPEAQEDHWFMYADDTHIRYYRSWTGMCAFEAQYLRRSGAYQIVEVKMDAALNEFGVNGDESGLALLRYLLTAEIGGDANQAWDDYLITWERAYIANEISGSGVTDKL